MKIIDRLDYCPHYSDNNIICFKNAPVFSGSVSASKIYTSENLHHTIRGPTSCNEILITYRNLSG